MAGAIPETNREYTQEVTGWTGWVVFAGIILLLQGVLSAMAGLVALFNDSYYLARGSQLVVGVDFTTWGWTHLILGALVAFAGIGLFSGQTWARVVAVFLAFVQAIVHVAFLAAYPLWSLIIIALDVVVIYALTVHGGELRGAA